jgi:hypothetical protein
MLWQFSQLTLKHIQISTGNVDMKQFEFFRWAAERIFSFYEDLIIFQFTTDG